MTSLNVYIIISMFQVNVLAELCPLTCVVETSVFSEKTILVFKRQRDKYLGK